MCPFKRNIILLKIKQFLTPPVFEDEDKTHVANLFSVMLLTLSLVAILRTVLTIFTVPEFTAFALRTNTALFAALMVSFIIIRIGYVKSACIGFTAYQWITIAWITYHNGGLNISIYGFFIFVILFSGLLLGGKWALLYAIISILYGALLANLEIRGLITPSLESPMAVFNITTISFITTTVLVYLYQRDMTRALKKARSNTDRLSQTNEQLIREISARERVEEQLLQAQKMEAIGTLAGGVAHDFNNSLQAILGYIQILLYDQQKDSAEFVKLKQIEAAALRASELTQQLLTFSRKVESKLRPVDLNQEVKHVGKILRRTIPKMIDIEIHLDKHLKHINADPAQIEQVMMNIGINARDAMPYGGKLSIHTKNVFLNEEFCKKHLDALPGDNVLLSISDSGTGMDKGVLDRVFDPFFTTKDPDKGTGLGLSMVYGIIKNHQGHIQAESKSGKGTTFKIYFPVISERRLTFSEPPATPEIRGGTETILLVDDESFLLKLGEEMLRRFGYQVMTAGNGENAIEIYKKNRETISLIILDIIMPGMGGYKCLEKILEIDPLQKVIIATGYSVNGSNKEFLKKGAKDFINKPYRLDQMLNAVRNVLDGQ